MGNIVEHLASITKATDTGVENEDLGGKVVVRDDGMENEASVKLLALEVEAMVGTVLDE